MTIIFGSVKKTIKYGEKYGGVLTKKQLFERLISNKIYKIDDLKKIKLDFKKNNKTKNYKQKIIKAKEMAGLIRDNFRDILLLGITGSVAAGYPNENDDIDIMIICKKNTIWINRLKLKFFLTIKKIPQRKFGCEEKGNEFCFNLWLDEESLKIEKGKQNLHNAVDLILIQPLVNKEKIYEKFLLSNDWVKKYLATGYDYKISNIKYLFPMKTKQILNIKCQINKIINWLMFETQYLYMKRRMKNERVGLHKAFFHR